MAESVQNLKIQHALSILSNLRRMRETEIECNLVIKVEGKELHVHRNIMRAGSPYYDAMFSHNMKERRTGIVEMKGIGFSVAQKCVTYLYTGEISITEKEECEPLLYAASMMQLAPVCDKIGLFLKSLLNAHSFFEIRRIAVKFYLEKLKTVCDDFAVKKLESIAKEEDFNQLELQYISSILTAKKLSGIEDPKLAVVLQWVKYDADNRHQHLPSLLDLLNLSKISESSLKYLVQQEKLVYQSAECMQMLCPARLDPDTVAMPPDLLFPSEQVVANSILIFDREAHSLQAYRPREKSCTKLHALGFWNRNARFTAVTFSDGWIYVLMENKKVYKLDINTKTPNWIDGMDMLDSHGPYLRGVVHDNCIYVVGRDKMEKYDRIQDKWERIELTRDIVCDSCALVEYDHDIFTIGGFEGGVDVVDIEVEDEEWDGTSLSVVNKMSTSTFNWSVVSSMLAPREDPGVAVYDEKIYVAGGLAANSMYIPDAEYYDPRRDIWTKIASMNIPRGSFFLCAIAEKLYAVGHDDDPQSIEAYDCKAEHWEPPEMLPSNYIESMASLAVWLPKK